MKLDYFLFMGEAEGIESITTTRQTRINAAIKDFIAMVRKGYDINNDDIQAVILEDHHIQDISEKECNYIAKAVERNVY